MSALFAKNFMQSNLNPCDDVLPVQLLHCLVVSLAPCLGCDHDDGSDNFHLLLSMPDVAGVCANATMKAQNNNELAPPAADNAAPSGVVAATDAVTFVVNVLTVHSSFHPVCSATSGTVCIAATFLQDHFESKNCCLVVMMVEAAQSLVCSFNAVPWAVS